MRVMMRLQFSDSEAEMLRSALSPYRVATRSDVDEIKYQVQIERLSGTFEFTHDDLRQMQEQLCALEDALIRNGEYWAAEARHAADAPQPEGALIANPRATFEGLVQTRQRQAEAVAAAVEILDYAIRVTTPV